MGPRSPSSPSAEPRGNGRKQVALGCGLGDVASGQNGCPVPAGTAPRTQGAATAVICFGGVSRRTAAQSKPPHEDIPSARTTGSSGARVPILGGRLSQTPSAGAGQRPEGRSGPVCGAGPLPRPGPALATRACAQPQPLGASRAPWDTSPGAPWRTNDGKADPPPGVPHCPPTASVPSARTPPAPPSGSACPLAFVFKSSGPAARPARP